MTATLGNEVSPRKLQLVRVKDLPEVFASAGKLNKDGKPLSVPRLSNLSQDDPKFPKPLIDELGSRVWRLSDVLAYARNWDQKPGPRFKTPPAGREG